MKNMDAVDVSLQHLRVILDDNVSGYNVCGGQ